MIDAKIQGQEVVAAPEEQELAPVIDIMEALRSSLNALKKPVATEVEAPEQMKLEVVGDAKKKRAGGGRRAG